MRKRQTLSDVCFVFDKRKGAKRSGQPSMLVAETSMTYAIG